MKTTALALVLLLAPAATPSPARGAGAPAAPMGAEERAFCQAELEVIEKRTKVFQTQGLPAAEIDRRNESARESLADCRFRFAAEQRRAAEEQEDLAEVDRRGGPNATELERERIWRQLRRERLSAKSPASLTPDEKAELAAGVREEVATTQETLDVAHARDPRFMRQVHSALACYHGARRADLRVALAHEESLLKVGTGDRTRLYAIRAELAQCEEVLARSREASQGFAEGLLRCSEPQTAVLAHCLGVRLEVKAAEPACESEQIQQYLRFIR